MVKIGVNGAGGRMGSRILELAKERPQDFEVVQTFDLEKHESLAPYAKGEKKLICDVLIDFSGPDGANWSTAAAHFSKKAVVIGSTGLDKETIKKIERTAAIVPVVFSSNMSVGVNLTLEVLELIARKLPKEFKIRISETHHIHKKDAPSGTALMLEAAIQKAMRSQQKIDIQSVREGEVVGDHTVVFSGPAETIEITHRAHSRDTFARGALDAARFAAKASPGKLYSMADVLR